MLKSIENIEEAEYKFNVIDIQKYPCDRCRIQFAN